MKVSVVWVAGVAAMGLAVTSPVSASPNLAGSEQAGPRTVAYAPAWTQVPSVTLPDRSQLVQSFLDRDGLMHVFFTVNEGLSVPPSLNVVSWQGTAWSPVTKLGPVPHLEAYPTVASELSSGIPTAGWTNYETVWLARYTDGAWSTTSSDVPGYAPDRFAPEHPFQFQAVGTALDGTTAGLFRTSGCSVKPNTLGCEWTVSWPAGESKASVTPGGSLGGTGSLLYWVSASGEVEVLFATPYEGPNIQIWSAKHRNAEWTDRTLVASVVAFTSANVSLTAKTVGDRLVVAWAQLDPQFGDTRQVASAQRNNGVWSAPEVLASGVDFAGLAVGGDGGPACVRYGKFENYRFGSVQARTLTNGAWSVPASLSTPGSTSSTNAPCLFFAVDGEFPRAALLGVTQTSAFLTPEAPQGSGVTVSRGQAWTVKFTGTSLNAARLTFSQASPPSAPTTPRAQSLKGAVKFSWAAPANPGAGPLTYEYRVGSGSWLKTTRTTVTLKAQKGKTVTISVRAVNSTGPGASLTISGKAK